MIFKLTAGASDNLTLSTVGGLDSDLAGVAVDLRAQGPRLWLPHRDTRDSSDCPVQSTVTAAPGPSRSPGSVTLIRDHGTPTRTGIADRQGFR